MTKKILIVDDEEQIRKLLESFLKKKGFDTVTAASGEEAIERMKSENPSIVLMDVNMPGIGGLSALKIIKEIDKKVGVIMITGVKEEDVAREAMQSAAFDYIVKPFDLNYLEMCLLTKIALSAS